VRLDSGFDQRLKCLHPRSFLQEDQNRLGMSDDRCHIRRVLLTTLLLIGTAFLFDAGLLGSRRR
jgi:hypothetical protein